MSITELLDDPAFRTIVDRFVAEIPNRVGNLRAAVDGQRFGEAQRLAHQLKGAGGSFGFDAITAAAASVENQCASHETGREFAASMDRLEMACEQVTSEWPATAVTV